MRRRTIDHAALLQVVACFNIAAEPVALSPFGSGHINDTFLVDTTPAGAPRYLLQRINHHVFQNIDGLMSNILKVTEHIRSKLDTCPAHFLPCDTMSLVYAKDQNSYVQDLHGNYWRLLLFLENMQSYDRVTSCQQAYEAGRAFGIFQLMVADMPGTDLVETIPDFHNIDMRLAKFEQAVQADVCGRAGEVAAEIALVRQWSGCMREVRLLGLAAQLPVRVTHNDTKFNNVLLNQEGRAICVVDLDTVMPGFIHYDYSDCIRTVTNTAGEDEPDVQKVAMSLDYFEAFNEGFLQQVWEILTPAERSSLVASAKLLPYIIGLRFLTDYLQDDIYFKTDYPTHNLVRARTQFALVKSMLVQASEMERVVATIVRKIESSACSQEAGHGVPPVQAGAMLRW